MNKFLLDSTSLLVWLGAIESARSHGVTLQYQTTSAIEVQAIYDSGQPLADAQVTVYAPDDPSQPWQTGTTDEQGRFHFIPAGAHSEGTWDVQIRSAGHGGMINIPASQAATSNDSVAAPSLPLAGSSRAQLTPLQTAVVVGSIIWGCVGTALFFRRASSSTPRSLHQQASE
jgi:nickel transport protein